MSRRAPSGPPALRQGWVYTLHFDPPYPPDAPPGAQQAKHYTGFTTDLDRRLAEHDAGQGAGSLRCSWPRAERGGWLVSNPAPRTWKPPGKNAGPPAGARCASPSGP